MHPKGPRAQKVEIHVKEAMHGHMYGTNPTPHLLWKQRVENVRHVPILWAERDDIEHQMEGCGGSTTSETNVAKFAAAIKASPVPPREDTRVGSQCFINGFPDEWKDFWLGPAKPIYTDVSAKDVAWTFISVV